MGGGFSRVDRGEERGACLLARTCQFERVPRQPNHPSNQHPLPSVLCSHIQPSNHPTPLTCALCPLYCILHIRLQHQHPEVREAKEAGNKAYKLGQFGEAVELYTKAVTLLVVRERKKKKKKKNCNPKKTPHISHLHRTHYLYDPDISRFRHKMMPSFLLFSFVHLFLSPFFPPPSSHATL